MRVRHVGLARFAQSAAAGNAQNPAQHGRMHAVAGVEHVGAWAHRGRVRAFRAQLCVLGAGVQRTGGRCRPGP
eukprot:5802350-Pleurochrysis_carterae.AAC.6